MTNKPLINGEAMNAALETTLAVELFLVIPLRAA